MLKNNWYKNIKIAKQPLYPLFYDYLHNGNEQDDWINDGTDLKDKTQTTQLGLSVGTDETVKNHPISELDPHGRSKSVELPTQDLLMNAYDTGNNSNRQGDSWTQHNPIQHGNQAFFDNIEQDPSNAIGIEQQTYSRIEDNDRMKKDRDPRQLSRMSSVWDIYFQK